MRTDRYRAATGFTIVALVLLAALVVGQWAGGGR